MGEPSFPFKTKLDVGASGGAPFSGAGSGRDLRGLFLNPETQNSLIPRDNWSEGSNVRLSQRNIEMKKQLVRGLLACTLFACGGNNDDTTLLADVPNETLGDLPEGAKVSDAVLVDSVEWNGERLQFFDATGEGDSSPAIMVSQLGGSGRSLVAEMEKQAQYPITSAEIWREATGRDEIPEVLMEQHLWYAASEGRPAEFQKFDFTTTEKATSTEIANFNVLFALNSATVGTATGALCWGDGSMAHTSVGGTPLQPELYRTDSSVCTSHPSFPSANGFVRHRPASFACDPVTNLNITSRVGMFNHSIVTVQGNICYASKSDAWSCFNQVQVLSNQFYANSFFKNGSAHRMAVGVFLSTRTFVAGRNQVDLAQANLKAELPQFQNNSCSGGFTTKNEFNTAP